MPNPIPAGAGALAPDKLADVIEHGIRAYCVLIDQAYWPASANAAIESALKLLPPAAGAEAGDR